MYVKTVKFSKNTIENFDELQSELQKKSPKGYCERAVNHMLAVSNRRICKSRSPTNRNIGSYYRTVFPVSRRATYTFRVPTDFGHGGMSLIDGKIMKQAAQDIWTKQNILDFSVTLD
jgi:hypothetical protein